MKQTRRAYSKIADAKRFALESPYPDAADYQKYLYAD